MSCMQPYLGCLNKKVYICIYIPILYVRMCIYIYIYMATTKSVNMNMAIAISGYISLISPPNKKPPYKMTSSPLSELIVPPSKLMVTIFASEGGIL